MGKEIILPKSPKKGPFLWKGSSSPIKSLKKFLAQKEAPNKKLLVKSFVKEGGYTWVSKGDLKEGEFFPGEKNFNTLNL